MAQRRVQKLRVDEGEIGEVGLVDVGDDQLVRRGQLGLRACEELVKVLCSFAALETREKGGGKRGLEVADAPKLHARSNQTKITTIGTPEKQTDITAWA